MLFSFALPNGTEVDGVRIHSVLGAGGAGISYRAEMDDRPVALKEYFPAALVVRADDGAQVQAAAGEGAANFAHGLEQFLAEAARLAAIDHTNVVTVRCVIEANGTAYAVMDYVDGSTLQSILEHAGTLPADEVDEVLEPLLAGLEAIHSAGFQHLDVKPANIMVNGHGVPVLVEFASARLALARRPSAPIQVVAAHYTPVELYLADGRMGPWTDIYGFGATLYRAVTGRLPVQSVERLLEDPLPPASQAAKGRYRPSLLRAVDQALVVDPTGRPQSVADFREVLAA